MGADLYIQSTFDKQRAEWEGPFERAVKRRNELAPGTAAFETAQRHVEHCYNELYSRGYFRDPYNDGDVLWKFDLSWWDDIIPLLDKRRRLSVERTREVISLLAEREPVFDEKLSALPEDEAKYFQERAAELRRFLQEAIDTNLPIKCSL